MTASAERGSGAGIDESSGSRVGATCLGGLIWTPAIPHGVLDAQVIAPQPYARRRMPPRRALVCRGAAGAEAHPSKNVLREAKFACVLSSQRRSFFVFGGEKTGADLKTVSQLLTGS